MTDSTPTYPIASSQPNTERVLVQRHYDSNSVGYAFLFALVTLGLLWLWHNRKRATNHSKAP